MTAQVCAEAARLDPVLQSRSTCAWFIGPVLPRNSLKLKRHNAKMILIVIVRGYGLGLGFPHGVVVHVCQLGHADWGAVCQYDFIIISARRKFLNSVAKSKSCMNSFWNCFCAGCFRQW